MSLLSVVVFSLTAGLIVANVSTDIFVRGKGCGGPAKEIRTREHVYYRFDPRDECTMITKVSEAGMTTDRVPGWSQWTLWNACDVACGQGRRNRTRDCEVKDALWRTATVDTSKCGDVVAFKEEEACDAGVC